MNTLSQGLGEMIDDDERSKCAGREERLVEGVDVCACWERGAVAWILQVDERLLGIRRHGGGGGQKGRGSHDYRL
jgi:hypothetical protein